MSERTLTFKNSALHYRGFEIDHYTKNYDEYGIEDDYSASATINGNFVHTESFNTLEYLLDSIDSILCEYK